MRHEISQVTEHLVQKMYNTSPSAGERCFLRILLFNHSVATSFSDLCFVQKILYCTFRETSCAMGLLSYDTEQLWCIVDASSSNFDHLSSVLSVIYLSANLTTRHVLGMRKEESKYIDFHRRPTHLGPYKALKCDILAENSVLNEIQASLTGMGSTSNL